MMMMMMMIIIIIIIIIIISIISNRYEETIDHNTSGCNEFRSKVCLLHPLKYPQSLQHQSGEQLLGTSVHQRQ